MVEIKNWTGGSSIQKKTILFFFSNFFWLSDISSQLFCVVYFIWLGFFEIRERFKLQKEKILDQKYITDDMIITLFLNVERSDKFFK